MFFSLSFFRGLCMCSCCWGLAFVSFLQQFSLFSLLCYSLLLRLSACAFLDAGFICSSSFPFNACCIFIYLNAVTVITAALGSWELFLNILIWAYYIKLIIFIWCIRMWNSVLFNCPIFRLVAATKRRTEEENAICKTRKLQQVRRISLFLCLFIFSISVVLYSPSCVCLRMH